MIINSLKKSVKVGFNKKLMFTVLFFTQLFFIIVISALFAHFAVKIAGDAQAVFEPLQESGLLSGDITAVYDNPVEAMEAYQNMIKNIWFFMLLVYLSYIVLNGLNWSLTSIMLGSKKNPLDYVPMFALLTVIFTVPGFVILYLLSKLLFTFESAVAVIILGVLVTLTVLYFMYISFALIDKFKLKQIGKLLKKTFKIGTTSKNVLVLLVTYLFMIIPVAIFFALIYLALEANFILLLILIIGFIKLIVWARVYFLMTMKNIK